MAGVERIALFDPVPAPSAWQIVASALRRKIDLGLLGPDDRLPPERDLADQMGVSRITVSQALAWLRGEGIIESHGRAGGTVVRARRVGRSNEKDLERLRGRETQAVSIVRRRALIESAAARAAAEVSSNLDIYELEMTIPPLQRAATELRNARLEMDDSNATQDIREQAKQRADAASIAFRRQDNLFHLTIAKAARDQRLYELIEELRANFFATIGSTLVYMELQKVPDEHRSILKALSQFDPERAERAMLRHMQNAGERITGAMDADPDSEAC